MEDEAIRELGVDDPATVDNLRVGLRQAVRRFLAEAGRPDVAPDRSLFVLHGRLQQAGGRSIDEMLGFYRVGGLVLWRRAAALAVAQDLPGGAVAALAEAVFAFNDDLAAAAAQGYAEAREDATLAADARRRQLVRALVRGEPAEEVEEAAALARWPLPAQLAVLVARAEDADALRAAVAPEGLVDVLDEVACALVAQDRVPRLPVPAVLAEAGPSEVGVALDRARQLLALVDARQSAHAEGSPALVRVADRRADLVVLAGGELARELADDRLAPLDALPAGRRARLLETLDAWLAHPGRPQAIADTLHLHVQSVRYRLGVLRELLGDALDDPAARFELALARRSRALDGGFTSEDSG